jgi:hypothetical protein
VLIFRHKGAGSRDPALFVVVGCLLAVIAACRQPSPPTPEELGAARARLEKRWLFVWRDMTDPNEVDRMIARLPQAAADGYNGVAFAYNVARSKTAALRTAAAASKLDLIAIVMGNPHDRDYVEGVPVKDAVFVARNGKATLVPHRPAIVNAGFERAIDDRFAGWTVQDAPGIVTFVDRRVRHGGRSSLRISNVGRSGRVNGRVMQTISLVPYRQYRVSFWVRTENLSEPSPEVKVLDLDNHTFIGFQTFRTAATQRWTQYHLVFNSFNRSRANLFLGYWNAGNGTIWFDDVEVEEIGLVNVLRRPGTPVAVRAENGVAYQEGFDFEPIFDPALDPWKAWHPSVPIQLTKDTRIQEGDRLRLSYYHPLIVHEDRLTTCLSEDRIFDDWRQEVQEAEERLHPAAFLMSHDELRVVNQCARCRSLQMTPGQLLAWNVRRAARIIRDVRPDVGIWVWHDMFDPLSNAVDRYYAVNGSLHGSWEGLEKDIGIINWAGRLYGRNAGFFADRGLKQILAGYYDVDDDGEGIAAWIAATARTPGIVGAMYTTWEDRYAAMGTWASRAWR